MFLKKLSEKNKASSTSSATTIWHHRSKKNKERLPVIGAKVAKAVGYFNSQMSSLSGQINWHKHLFDVLVSRRYSCIHSIPLLDLTLWCLVSTKRSSVLNKKNLGKCCAPFFKTIKSKETITIIENENIILNDKKVAETFHEFFSNVVKTLNIPQNPYLISGTS